MLNPKNIQTFSLVSCALALAILLPLFTASYWTRIGPLNTSASSSRIESGSFTLYYVNPPSAGRSVGYPPTLTSDPLPFSIQFSGVSISYSNNHGVSRLYLTLSLLWPIALLVSIPTIAFAYRRWAARKRYKTGHCEHCGYDMRASPDKCPECGLARQHRSSQLPIA